MEKNLNTNTQDKKSSKLRMILVIAFVFIFLVMTYIQTRGSYLEYLELGENYVQMFWTNMIYRYSIMAVNFVVLFFIIYMTNRGIKKGLKVFFDKEKKPMPKLINKSLALVIASIVSVILSGAMMQKIMLVKGNTSFGITDPIIFFKNQY